MLLTIFNSALIPVLTIIGTALVIALAYLAQYLAKAGDMLIEVRRMAYLDPLEVRLVIRFISTKKGETEFHNIVIARKNGKKYEVISEETPSPIIQEGSKNSIRPQENGYSIHIIERKVFEGIFYFSLKEGTDSSDLSHAFLLATNKSGKQVKAPIDLLSTEIQSIHFKRF